MMKIVDHCAMLSGDLDEPLRENALFIVDSPDGTPLGGVNRVRGRKGVAEGDKLFGHGS